jgi:hypothetical protein
MIGRIRGRHATRSLTQEEALLESILGKVLIANEADVKKLGDNAPRSPLQVSRVQTEQQVVEAAGASYVRLTITDRMGPTPEESRSFSGGGSQT